MTPGDYKIAKAALAQADRVAEEIAPARGSTAIQFILAQARRTSVDAAVELMAAPADNPEAIRELQFKASLFGRMVDYLAQAVQAGDDAAQMLRELDKDELSDLIAGENGVDDT